MAMNLGVLGRLFQKTVRAFDVGKNSRRMAAIPSVQQNINRLIRTYGKTVLARSRYLATNNPYSVAAKDEFVSALVGDGIKPSSLSTDAAFKKQLQELWLEWTDQADADGLTDFYGLQSIGAAELFEAGEFFVRIRSRRAEDGIIVPMQLQLLPAEMLPIEKNETAVNGNTIEMGVEFDLIGRRVAYHFLKMNPGSDIINYRTAADSTTTVRIPAEEVLHVFKPIRIGQIRGIPYTLASMITLAMVDLYDDAELERKRTTALFAAFVEQPVAEDDDNPLGIARDQYGNKVDTGSQFAMEPGAVIDLKAGEKVSFSAPSDVGSQYDAFEYRMLLRAAAGVGVPYSSMTGDLRQVNYSSIRAGLVVFRRRIQAMQNQVLIFQMCRPVWQHFMDLAAVVGELSIPASVYQAGRRQYIRVKWIPPKWDWVDPLKDRQAEKLAVDNRFKSRDDVIEAEGYDPEEVDARIAASIERAARLKIPLPAAATVDSSGNAPATDPNADPANADQQGAPNAAAA